VTLVIPRANRVWEFVQSLNEYETSHLNSRLHLKGTVQHSLVNILAFTAKLHIFER